jgi:hypothetical protein
MWFLVLSFAWVTLFPFVSRFITVLFIQVNNNIWIFGILVSSLTASWSAKLSYYPLWIMIYFRAYNFGSLGDGRRCCCYFFLFSIHHPLETFSHSLNINLQVLQRMTLLAPFVWLLQPFRFWLFHVSTGTHNCVFVLFRLNNWLDLPCQHR